VANAAYAAYVAYAAFADFTEWNAVHEVRLGTALMQFENEVA
jgi:hypothetical protein